MSLLAKYCNQANCCSDNVTWLHRDIHFDYDNNYICVQGKYRCEDCGNVRLTFQSFEPGQIKQELKELIEYDLEAMDL